MKTNAFLTALILWERIIPILKLDSREQINRSNLKLINDYTGHIVKQLNNVSYDDTLVLSNLAKASDIEQALLSNACFTETDTEIKNELGKLYCVSDKVFVAAGQFYIENEFEYSPKYGSILNTIIETSIRNGYTFGY